MCDKSNSIIFDYIAIITPKIKQNNDVIYVKPSFKNFS